MKNKKEGSHVAAEKQNMRGMKGWREMVALPWPCESVVDGLNPAMKGRTGSLHEGSLIVAYRYTTAKVPEYQEWRRRRRRSTGAGTTQHVRVQGAAEVSEEATFSW